MEEGRTLIPVADRGPGSRATAGRLYGACPGVAYDPDRVAAQRHAAWAAGWRAKGTDWRPLLMIVLRFPVTDAWGYRPLVSTEAAVADPQDMEIELGYVTLKRAA